MQNSITYFRALYGQQPLGRAVIRNRWGQSHQIQYATLLREDIAGGGDINNTKVPSRSLCGGRLGAPCRIFRKRHTHNLGRFRLPQQRFWRSQQCRLERQLLVVRFEQPGQRSQFELQLGWRLPVEQQQSCERLLCASLSSI